MVKFLDLKRQYLEIKNEIDKVILNVIDDCAFIGGKYVNEFEEKFSEYQGVKQCVGVGNGTDALEIAIESVKLQKGTEIIVPANSFIATSEAVTRTGHKVVFCDCDPQNYTISIDDLKEKITPDTSAVIPVHLYGHPCDMDPILETARDNSLKVIEDCAQAHGAEYKGRRVGAIGDIGIFSFYPGKNLGAYGDSGAIVTNDMSLAEKCRMISNHGRLEKYNHEFEGRNSRLDGLQAAILSVKLKYLDEWTQTRISLAETYYNRLADERDIILPKNEEWSKHVYHLYVIRTSDREGLREFLTKDGIQTGIHYPISLPRLRAYQYLNQGSENMTANKIDRELLSLPIGEHLSRDDVDSVIYAIKKYINQ